MLQCLMNVGGPLSDAHAEMLRLAALRMLRENTPRKQYINGFGLRGELATEMKAAAIDTRLRGIVFHAEVFVDDDECNRKITVDFVVDPACDPRPQVEGWSEAPQYQSLYFQFAGSAMVN